MSRKSTRAAISRWLQPPNILGLNQVVEGAPIIMDGAKFNLASQGGWGALGFVHLQHQDELRIAFGGQKFVRYEAVLMLLFQMVLRPGFDIYSSPAAYVDPLDSLLDSTIQRIRSDHVFGTTGVLNGATGIQLTTTGSFLQAGEGDLGGNSDDIIIDSDFPKWDSSGGKVWSWHAVMFRVVEGVTLP